MTREVPDEVPLDDFHSWLYTVAASMLPDGFWDPDLEDLVQEGRIAMWKAFADYEDGKGTLAPWLTGAARMRMRDVARGHGRWTGHTGRRGWTDAMSHAERPLSVDLLRAAPEFDERRFRMPVAASVKMTSKNARQYASA